MSRSGHALARWLMREVHGVDIGRKPPKRATSLRSGPPRSWKYRQWIRSLPCAACGSDYRVEAAHTGSDGGMQLKPSDFSCVPLCADCHTMGPDAYHRIGREEFERRNGLDLKALVARLTGLWFGHAGEVK